MAVSSGVCARVATVVDSVESDTRVMSASDAGSLADRLEARRSNVLTAYRNGLSTSEICATADEQAWLDRALPVNRIFTVCVAAMTTRCRADENSANSGNESLEIVGFCIDPHVSTRAGTILFEVTLAELASVVQSESDGGRLVVTAANALNKTIQEHVQAAVKQYEDFSYSTARVLLDADRKRLARELHDRIGSSVGVAMRRLEVAELEGSDSAAVRSAISVLSEVMCRLAVLTTEVRSNTSVGCLRIALAAFVESMRLTEPVVTVRVHGAEDWATAEVLDEVFLILRECLRNAIAHAQAREVTVDVEFAPSRVHAVVRDDGIGFVPGATRRSNGLRSISERAELLSGSVAIRSVPSRGTRVALRIPLQVPLP